MGGSMSRIDLAALRAQLDPEDRKAWDHYGIGDLDPDDPASRCACSDAFNRRDLDASLALMDDRGRRARGPLRIALHSRLTEGQAMHESSR
jgi:hypothetical protein